MQKDFLLEEEEQILEDNECPWEEDEQLAKAIQGFRVCAGCNTKMGYESLNHLGAVWHLECFKCCACNQPINDEEFSMLGTDPYHGSCYKELNHPKCDVCKHSLPTNAAGLIECVEDPIWIQKYCNFHEFDGTPHCCSCERMEPRETRFVTLEDGWKFYIECIDLAIMETHERQPLYFDMQEINEEIEEDEGMVEEKDAAGIGWSSSS